MHVPARRGHVHVFLCLWPVSLLIGGILRTKKGRRRAPRRLIDVQHSTSKLHPGGADHWSHHNSHPLTPAPEASPTPP
ncbi:hypothetical protein F5883DRAFT_566212 [Diaporthe sp. PMI_573]|nr:hypothetical protein F5883DRAFT_566212 [Diaporthaceae sp. PMI_573]